MVQKSSKGKSVLALIVILFFLASCASTKKAAKVSATSPQQVEADTTTSIAEEIEVVDTVKTVIDTLVFEEEKDVAEEVVKADTIRVIGVGDIMLGTNYPKASYLPPSEGKGLLDDAIDLFKTGDIVFGNLEGVILDGEGEPKNCRNPDACYLFRMPSYMATRLKEAGFDMLSIANNHAGDFGDTGRKSTMDILDSIGIHYAGQLSAPFTTFTKNDVTYGFIAFSPNTGTLSINDVAKATELVQHLDSLSDIVLVSFHGGAEGKNHQHVTKERETFYGENRGNVYEFSHAVIDAGADIVFGHGPHVVRAVEVYQNRFISYSLGNFATYARFNISGPNKLAPAIEINISEEGEFINGRIHSFKQIGAGYPVKDIEGNAIKTIRNLTQEDLPEAQLLIDDLGNINYIKDEL